MGFTSDGVLLGIKEAHWILGLSFGIPLIYHGMWRLFLQEWIQDALVNHYKKNSAHPTTVELHVVLYMKIGYFLSYFIIALIMMSVFDLWHNESITSVFIYSSIFVSIVSVIGGKAVLGHILSGLPILFGKYFGKGDYCKCTHPHKATFEGWVTEVDLMTTMFLTKDFTQVIISNVVLLEFFVENFDRPPIHFVNFELSVKDKSFERFLVNKVTEQIAKKNEINDLIAVDTQFSDKKWFQNTFSTLNDDTWESLRKPQTILKNGSATLRVPVRSFAEGEALRQTFRSYDIFNPDAKIWAPPVKEVKQ